MIKDLMEMPLAFCIVRGGMSIAWLVNLNKRTINLMDL